ncbi:hypothetical protein QR680_006458 [Steinernema hermaphroditum]|uniref:alpha-1,2-Mannosidase n=1 Tax=Steinernema hermaphroditum TaxID=289476 RepID=A0AA39HVH5_9BILA|nr:hypothetical protein QR680_006458 [Steinernema hermaphroditum]
MLLRIPNFLLVLLLTHYNVIGIEFSREKMLHYRDRVKSMFYHAYNGYLEHAYPLDELKPITCSGMDTWGSFSLTLIDALDTLVIMGNETEFKRAVDLVLANVKVDANVNVSVFETNIRVVGGLLSAHLMSGRVKDMNLDPGWPCSGPLLALAERFAQKLLPAFNTETGMPYGTVNLKYGVHRYETPVTCTAGVGTFILEFGTLSRLTGNPHYERIALKALQALWKSRSTIGLVGNHINVKTGAWTATDAGIGAGVDSYFEYLAKGALLFQRPLLMRQFNEYEKAINKHVRKDDWFMWVSMTKGQVSLPVFQSLEAFWPGVLTLVGNVEDARRIMLTYNQVVRQYGFPPEFYHINNLETVAGREGYPLRPEVVESLMYLYRSTDDPSFLHIAAGMIEAIDQGAKTKCGYATVKNVNDLVKEDRMESFFLSETTKYLYLLFDPDNFMHNDGSEARIVHTTNGECALDAGGYIFNTEAHPIDPAALYCCGSKRQKDVEMLQKFEDNIDFVSLLDLDDPALKELGKKLDEKDLSTEAKDLGISEEDQDRAVYFSRNYNYDDVEYEVEKEEDVPQYVDKKRDEREQVGSAGLGVEAVEVGSQQTHIPAPVTNEEEQRKIANREMKKLVNNVARIDKALKHNKRTGQSSEKLTEMLKKMKHEYGAVLNASKDLERLDIKRFVKQLEKEAKAAKVPVVAAECEGCCRKLDERSDSIALRKMLNTVYGKHLYPRQGVRFVQGPICAESDKPTIEKQYFNIPPEVSSTEEFSQTLDVIEAIDFSTFKYSRLALEQFDLLSAPIPGFASLFTGGSQVLAKTVANATVV